MVDRHPIPSPDSAGYDLNKIFRTEYSDPLYSRLSHEARHDWLTEEVLKGCYHEVGYVFAVSGDSQKRCMITFVQTRGELTAYCSIDNWQAAVDNSIKQGVKFDKLETPADFKAKAPVLNGSLKCVVGIDTRKMLIDPSQWLARRVQCKSGLDARLQRSQGSLR